MRNGGRINWLVLALVTVVLLIVVLVTLSGETSSVAARRFMKALSMGDAKTLTDMSYFEPERSKEEVLKSWERTVEIGRFYRFSWNIKNSKSPASGRSTVSMDFTRDADNPNSYGETFSLDMIQKDGKWLVDVKALSRDMYPALPR